jgi:hypothetical protein
MKDACIIVIRERIRYEIIVEFIHEMRVFKQERPCFIYTSKPFQIFQGSFESIENTRSLDM